MAHKRTNTLLGATNRSSIFFTASHDKRNILWKAFRKTVLEPRGIYILENASTDKVPEVLLELVEEMCQNLDRHEKQASSFREDVAQGRGFGPSPIFPPDVVPPINDEIGLSRCMEPTFDKQTLPPHSGFSEVPLFELPIPRPGLACGFSSKAFTSKEFRDLPEWITAVGTFSDYDTGQIQPGQAIHVPFLMFERTYGHARHEIEAAMNYCAMDGAAALHAISLLFEKAWPTDDWNRPASPVVFSCTVDDDVGIIHHHWISGQKEFMAAPLCKFDLRDSEHFMHFLAWIEAIEQWAVYFLLPDVKEAINILSGAKVVKALLTPVTIEEKNEKLKRSMKLAFDNIPWRNQRVQGAPLAVTAAMRFRGPRAEEVVVPVGNVVASSEPVSSATSQADYRISEGPSVLPSSARTMPDENLPHPSPVQRSQSTAPMTMGQSSSSLLPSPSTAGRSIERSRSPKRSNADMLPPPREDYQSQSYVSDDTTDTGAIPQTSSKADIVARSKSSATSVSGHDNSGSIYASGTIPQPIVTAIQSPPASASSMETIYIHHSSPRSRAQNSQRSPNSLVPGLAIATEFPGVHSHVSQTTPATVIRYKPPVALPGTSTPATAIEKKLPDPFANHNVPPRTKTPPPVPVPLSIIPNVGHQSTIAAPSTSVSSISSASSVQSKRSLPSLRQQKRIRSPATPESAFSSTTSPKTSTSSSTFRSKISNSLGMIKEHTLSRPKRPRMDNSGPRTPKPGDEPLPTPAYDKRRFAAPDNGISPGQTTAQAEHVLQERPMENGRSKTGSTGARTPGTAGTGTGATIAASPPSRNKNSTPLTMPVQNFMQANQSLTQAAIPSAGSSNYLPLRNYGGVPEGTKAVTVTAGAI